MEHDLVPAFAALAHPQRLDVVRLLVRRHPNPVPAGTIGVHLGLKPSTLSGYLAQLVETGLIVQERRGTSLLYSVALDGIAAINSAWIGGICQGRGLPEFGAPGPRIRNLLFVGHGNRGFSLMAEAVFRTLAGQHYEVFSAGIAVAGGRDDARQPDPKVLALLQAQGYETDVLWSKPIDVFVGAEAPVMDVVITLSDATHIAMPQMPGCPIFAPWTLPEATSGEDMLMLLDARLRALSDLDPLTATRRKIQDILDYHRDTVLAVA